MNPIFPSTLALLAACALAPGLGAKTLFSDNFSDNNTNGWFASATNSLSAGNGAMQVTAGRHAQAAFPATTLAVGDTITLSFDVTFAGSKTFNQYNAFRFGLFDSNGTATPKANGNSRFAPYDGIIATTNPGATSGSPVAFRSRVPGLPSTAVGYDSLIIILNPYKQVGENGGAAGVFPTARPLRVTLALTRTDTGLDLFYSARDGVDEIQYHSVQTSSPPTTTFDVLAVSALSAIGDFTLHNVNVSVSSSR